MPATLLHRYCRAIGLANELWIVRPHYPLQAKLHQRLRQSLERQIPRQCPSGIPGVFRTLWGWRRVVGKWYGGG